MLERDRGHVYAGLMLDHDLQDRAITAMDRHLSGRHVVQAVVRHIDPDVPILVHSMNFNRAPENVQSLESAGFTVTRISMGQITRTDFLAWLREVHALWGEGDFALILPDAY